MCKKTINKKPLVFYGCEWTIDGKEESGIFSSFGRCIEKVANEIMGGVVFCDVVEKSDYLCAKILYIDNCQKFEFKSNTNDAALFLKNLAKDFGKEIHCHIQELELTLTMNN